MSVGWAGWFAIIGWLVVCGARGSAAAQSVFPLRPDDAHAIYLTKADFGAVGDGVADDADALQAAVDKAQETLHHGIVFVPEGRYRLSHTVYVWAGIRLIGYGAKRPVLVLGANTPGFQTGICGQMLFFVDERPPDGQPQDASEFTFFSAVSNIDFEIGAGNPAAVAIRFNVAQHSFVAHANFNLAGARAAIQQVGNQAYDIHVHGGQYGIETEKTSPAWQFLLMDSTFDGQQIAAIKTQEAGMTLIRDRFEHAPMGIDIPQGRVEQLYGRDLVMRDVGEAVRAGDKRNVRNEITLENVVCDHVTRFSEGEPDIFNGDKPRTWADFVEERFTMGLQIAPDGRERGIREEHRGMPLSAAEEKKAEESALKTDIPALPPMSTWVNVRTLGVKGDGATDDTSALQKAINNHKALYFPSGFYRLRGPLWLWGDTVLIGLSPFTTQFVLSDHDENFAAPGAPIPMVVAPDGAANIMTGIGIATGNGNPRAMGVEWQAGEHSLLEDVDFQQGRSEYVQALEPAVARPPAGARPPMEENAQYPSLWVKGGGGVLRGIWSHATTAKAGLVIEDTTRKGAIYQFSCEHHMQNEVRLKNVRHWRIFDLQTEEENPAGQDAVAVDLDGVHNVTFANTYMYRVSRTILPKPYAVVAKGADSVQFDNVKVFSQTRLAFDNSVHEEDGGVDVRAHHFVHFALAKDARPGAPLPLPEAFAPGAKLERVATGYSNADGLTAGPDGTVYFTDAARHRILKIDPETEKVSPLSDTGQSSPQVLGWAGTDEQGRGELLAINREKTVMAVDAATGTLSRLNGEGVARPDTTLLLPVGLHNELVFLERMLGHVGITYRVGSNTAIRSDLEPEERDYFYAPGTNVAAMGGAQSWKWRPLLESSQLAPFAVGDSHLVVSEDDEKTWRATLEPGEKLATRLFAERGGTSVVEDAAGNAYIASGQVYVYDRQGHEEGVLEIPERPGSLCFGGRDGKTLFIGARGSVYAVRVRARGRD